MGWWWSSDLQAPGAKALYPTPDPISTHTEPLANFHELIDKPTQLRGSSSQEANRDAKANDEFSQILSELGASVSATETRDRSTTKYFKPAFDPRAAFTSTNRDEDSLYPSEMSCRDAFDQAFYCQSLGGQFNNVYRYGEFRSCSEHWSAFWFCMKTRSMSENAKREKIREFYKRRDAKYKTGPSSEDVWQIRTEPIAKAFDQDPDLVDIPGLSKGIGKRD